MIGSGSRGSGPCVQSTTTPLHLLLWALTGALCAVLTLEAACVGAAPPVVGGPGALIDGPKPPRLHGRGFSVPWERDAALGNAPNVTALSPATLLSAAPYIIAWGLGGGVASSRGQTAPGW